MSNWLFYGVALGAALHLGCSQSASAPTEGTDAADEAQVDGARLVRLGQRVHVAPPFTGTALWKYRNGKRHTARTFKNGILEGPMVSWFNDGTTEAYTVNYKVNRKDGPAIGYYPSGKKRFEIHYKMGMRIETETWWHTNGQKSLEYKWVRGRPVMTNAWNAAGKVMPPPKPRIRRPLRQPNRRPPVKGGANRPPAKPQPEKKD